METVRDFIFLCSKIIEDGECSHEMKRHLLLESKAMKNLDSVLKSRHHFANKGLSNQTLGMVFPIVMHECCPIKKAEC